jgi:hypothetical protein
MQAAGQLFKHNPREALSVLRSMGVVGDSPADQASFFFSGINRYPELPGPQPRLRLSHKAVGEYMAEPSPDSQAVLQAYLELLDFEVSYPCLERIMPGC